MVIVGGTFEVDPAQRDRYLAEREEAMRRSRSERGCLEYVFAADPLEPSRVVLFERWQSQEALDAHLAALRADPPDPTARAVPSLSGSITVYEVSGSRTML